MTNNHAKTSRLLKRIFASDDPLREMEKQNLSINDEMPYSTGYGTFLQHVLASMCRNGDGKKLQDIFQKTLSEHPKTCEEPIKSLGGISMLQYAVSRRLENVAGLLSIHDYDNFPEPTSMSKCLSEAYEMGSMSGKFVETSIPSIFYAITKQSIHDDSVLTETVTNKSHAKDFACWACQTNAKLPRTWANQHFLSMLDVNDRAAFEKLVLSGGEAASSSRGGRTL